MLLYWQCQLHKRTITKSFTDIYINDHTGRANYDLILDTIYGEVEVPDVFTDDCAEK